MAVPYAEYKPVTAQTGWRIHYVKKKLPGWAPSTNWFGNIPKPNQILQSSPPAPHERSPFMKHFDPPCLSSSFRLKSIKGCSQVYLRPMNIALDIDTTSASIMAFAGLSRMITSTSARAARGAVTCLPPPATPPEPSHAREREPAEHHARTAPPHPFSFRAAERARPHSNCDLSSPWYGMVMTGGTRPSAGHASGSACRCCRGQAPRPGRRRPLSLAALTGSAPQRERESPRHVTLAPNCAARARQRACRIAFLLAVPRELRLRA